MGRHYIADATSEEESQMSSAVSFSINRQGHICGITKRGGAGLDPSVILDMISVSKHVSEQLMIELDSKISAAEAYEAESWFLNFYIGLCCNPNIKNVDRKYINSVYVL